MPILVGIVSLILGIAFLVKPLTAGAVVTWVAAFCVLILGVLWLILAFRAPGICLQTRQDQRYNHQLRSTTRELNP